MTDHAYRSARIRPYCSQCGTVTDGACLRCGRPLCDEHRPAAHRRCEACERDYSRGGLRYRWPFLLFFLYLPAFMLLQRWLVRDSQDELRLGIALLLSMPVLGVAAIWIGRRRFLRERVQRVAPVSDEGDDQGIRAPR